MRIRTMCVCVCVCALTFIASLALHCNFVCNAALLREGIGIGGRYVGYGPGWNTLSSAMNECRLNNCLVRQQSHSKGD